MLDEVKRGFGSEIKWSQRKVEHLCPFITKSNDSKF